VNGATPLNILAIDPGPLESAALVYQMGQAHILHHSIMPNRDIEMLVAGHTDYADTACLAVEWIGYYGPDMHAGASVFETCYHVGRFARTWDAHCDRPLVRIKRKKIVSHVCGLPSGKDTHVRRALIGMDRFGGIVEKSIGGKKCDTCHGKGWRGRDHHVCQGCQGTGWKYPPGPLHGIHDDEWAALALAVTVDDLWDDLIEVREEGPATVGEHTDG